MSGFNSPTVHYNYDCFEHSNQRQLRPNNRISILADTCPFSNVIRNGVIKKVLKWFSRIENLK